VEDTPLDGWNRPATAREKPPRVASSSSSEEGQKWLHGGLV